MAQRSQAQSRGRATSPGPRPAVLPCSVGMFVRRSAASRTTRSPGGVLRKSGPCGRYLPNISNSPFSESQQNSEFFPHEIVGSLGERKAGIWPSGNQVCLVRKISPVSQRITTLFAAAFSMLGRARQTCVPACVAAIHGKAASSSPATPRRLPPPAIPQDDISSLFNSFPLAEHSDDTHQPPVDMWRLTGFHM